MQYVCGKIILCLCGRWALRRRSGVGGRVFVYIHGLVAAIIFGLIPRGRSIGVGGAENQAV